ncbi:MAG: hypothetical protein ACFE8J_12515 [Candidatus Heimdallarchaeota archaeon]
MTESYEEFIVYDLENSGERKRLDLKQEDLSSYLKPDQVLIIIREDLRRIYIWKGAKSPVRKRFISSKVAQELQTELLKDPRYHRCKIVSIDQGDELQEFLNAFKLESMEVTERLPDMRYIRNIERDRIKEAERLAKGKGTVKEQDENYYSPALSDTSNDVVVSSFAMGISKPPKRPEKMIKPSAGKHVLGYSEQEKQRIKERILKVEVPENLERQNLILGHTLYAAVSKVAEVFGKNMVDIVWEEVKKLPEGMMELDNNMLRVYFNQKKGIVEAVEVLKKGEKGNVIFSPNDKDQNKEIKPKSTIKRNLPKIPNAKD